MIEKKLTNWLTPWHQNPKFGRECFITKTVLQINQLSQCKQNQTKRKSRRQYPDKNLSCHEHTSHVFIHWRHMQNCIDLFLICLFSSICKLWMVLMGEEFFSLIIHVQILQNTFPSVKIRLFQSIIELDLEIQIMIKMQTTFKQENSSSYLH